MPNKTTTIALLAILVILAISLGNPNLFANKNMVPPDGFFNVGEYYTYPYQISDLNGPGIQGTTLVAGAIQLSRDGALIFLPDGSMESLDNGHIYDIPVSALSEDSFQVFINDQGIWIDKEPEWFKMPTEPSQET